MDLFKTLIASFTSVNAYRNAAFNWTWKAVIYFFMVVGIASATSTYFVLESFNKYYDSDIKPAIVQMTGAVLENNRITTPEHKDMEIKNSQGQTIGVISENYIDASKSADLIFAFEKDRFTIFQNGGESTFPLNEAGVSDTKSVKITDLLPTITEFYWVILPIFSVLAVVFILAIYVGLLSIAALILSSTMLPNLGFWKCVKIAIVSITPPVLINSAMILTIGIALPSWLYALISGGLIWFAMSGMRRQILTEFENKKDLP